MSEFYVSLAAGDLRVKRTFHGVPFPVTHDEARVALTEAQAVTLAARGVRVRPAYEVQPEVPADAPVEQPKAPARVRKGGKGNG